MGLLSEPKLQSVQSVLSPASMIQFLLLLVSLVTQLSSCQAESCSCRPKSVCIGQFSSFKEAVRSLCNIPGTTYTGFCCKDIQASKPTKSKGRRPSRKMTSSTRPGFVQRRKQESVRKPRVSPISSETAGHYRFTKPRKEFADIGEAANILFRQG